MANIDDTAITRVFIPSTLQPSTERPGFWGETVPAAFRLENTVASVAANEVRPDGAVFDPTFDPFESMREEDREYARRFAFADTPQDVAQIQAQIDRELRDRDTVAQAGALGVVSLLSAGILDPVNLIPIGGVAVKTYRAGRTARILENAASFGQAGFVGSTAAEVFLQQSQITRSYGESATNIAAGTILSGALGGAGTALVQRLSGRGIDDIVAQIDSDLTVYPGPGGSVGAATTRSLDAATEAKIREGIAEQVRMGDIDDADEAFRAAAAVTRELLVREGIDSDWAVNAGLKIVGRQDPTLRLLQSPSVEVRELGQRMFETPLSLAKNQYGGASPLNAFALIRQHEAKLIRAVKKSEDAYVEYAQGRSRRFGSVAKLAAQRNLGLLGTKISHKQFREFTGQAMRRGDDAADIPGVPEDAVQHINRAASHYRKEVFEPLKDAAIKEGLLPEDVDVDTAISYLTRMYRRERMVEDRQEFIDTTKAWLARRQSTAAERAQSFAAEEAALKKDIAGLRSQIRSIQKAVKTGTQEGSAKATREAVDAAFERFETDLTQRAEDILGQTPSAEKAGKAAASAFRREFIKRLVEDVKEGVLDAVDENATKILDDIARQIDEADGPDALALIRDQLARAGEDVAGEAGARAAGGSLTDAAEEGFIAAQKAFERSLKSQAKKIRELTEDPEALAKAATDRELSEINRNIRTTAANKARKAVQKATAETRKLLAATTKKLAQRRKLQGRDAVEADMTDDELLSLAEEIYNRILGTPVGRLPYDRNPQKVNAGAARVAGARALKERVFNIEDELIESFLESDIELVAREYVRSMAPDIEMVKAFGDLEMTSEFKKIQDAYDRMFREPGADNQALAKAMRRDFRDLKTIRDRLLNQHGLPDDPMAWTFRTGRFVRQLNYTRLLGGMTLSAVPDVARPVMVHGLVNTLRDGLLPLITQFSKVRRFSAELEDMGIAADLFNNSRMRAIADVQDDMVSGTKAERGMTAVSDTFGMVSLMAPWNKSFKTIAAAVSMGRLTRAMRADIAGTINKKELEFLRANYVDSSMARRIMAELDAADAARPGELVMPGEAKWGDKDAYRTFQSALNRDVDRTIITPGLDRPTMADATEVGRLIFQFKSFAIAATQRMLLSGLQQKDLATLNGLVLSVGLGMLTTKAKMWDRGRGEETRDWTLEKWLVEGVDRSGVTGWLFDVNNIVEKASRGALGMSALVGGEQASRYQSRNTVGALLGPSFGTAVTAVGVFGNTAANALGDEELRQSDIHAIRRLVPYQNLMGLRRLLDEFERGLGQSIGAVE